MKVIANNIRRLRALKKISLQELADALGVHKQTFAAYEQDRSDPPIPTLIAISDYFRISMDTLSRYDLTKLTDQSIRQLEKGWSKDTEGRNLRILHSTVDSYGKENIELVPVKSTAGYPKGYRDPEFVGNLPTFHLPFLPKERKYRAFQIEGESMLPIPDKSYVIGEYVQNLKSLKDGVAYVIVTLDDGVVFKVVHNEIKKNGKLLLKSLNPNFQPYHVELEKVLEAWKFVNYFTGKVPDYYGELATIKNEFKFMSEKLEKLSRT